MPTIRIDDDVYAWLKSLATPFEDTPNTVLRRIAGLDGTICHMPRVHAEQAKVRDETPTEVKDRVVGRTTGKYLNELWNVGAAHALYHHDGTFYENLRTFPGALFDYHGFVVFQNEAEYTSCPYLNIGEKLNVHQGIKSIPRYKSIR